MDSPVREGTNLFYLCQANCLTEDQKNTDAQYQQYSIFLTHPLLIFSSWILLCSLPSSFGPRLLHTHRSGFYLTKHPWYTAQSLILSREMWVPRIRISQWWGTPGSRSDHTTWAGGMRLFSSTHLWSTSLAQWIMGKMQNDKPIKEG